MRKRRCVHSHDSFLALTSRQDGKGGRSPQCDLCTRRCKICYTHGKTHDTFTVFSSYALAGPTSTTRQHALVSGTDLLLLLYDHIQLPFMDGLSSHGAIVSANLYKHGAKPVPRGSLRWCGGPAKTWK